MRRGHPWIFGESFGKRQPGTLIAMRDRDGIAGWGLVDRGEISVRVLGRGDPPERPLSAIIAQRIHDADAVRWRLITGDTNCWRVVNGEGDGLPGIVVDRYDDVAVLRVYSVAWTPYLEAIVKAICKLPWVSTLIRRHGVRRVNDRKDWDLLFGPKLPDVMVVREHGWPIQ